jgi:hypothetical protein
MLGFMAEVGIDSDNLRQAFALSNEIAPAITRLVIADLLAGSGRVRRITPFDLGPRILIAGG